MDYQEYDNELSVTFIFKEKKPVSRSDHFLKVIKTLEEKLDILPSETLESKIHDIVKYWKLKGIEPGSDSAMEIEDL